MSYLFDASSIMNITKYLRRDAVKVLRNNYVLDLTIYEVGNAIWRETALLKYLVEDEALTMYKDMLKIFSYMNIVKPKNPELVLNLAMKIRLTYYDAAYVTVASEEDLTLVTDDKKLIKVINDNRKAIIELLHKDVTVKSSDIFIGRNKQ
ncbi:type II toxin-antitoxin system VapC family toxin [Vulcanisaeta distributa]|uniref:PilT protein domain protein n=1 Tax=Vulcanisaeta distributa (strain DSM 14429 / JCM 11212 / NBRC 100878 / IC-017) TaxID=572478 RepID=E1QS06_VULDI|nr:type II toxin-antitoxin system VapC family toxin [Vulcanisaeta distributa]ADN50723.1 conserved hypothetical protein [Vulcanisaeta distributa DSM 14429]